MADRLVFVHIGKTAGTWIKSGFWEHFRDDACPAAFKEDFSNIAAMKNRYRFFAAHIGYQTAVQLDGRLITMLRHPVDRFLSTYYYWREVEVPPRSLSYMVQGEDVAKALSLEEFIESREAHIISDLHNAQAWQIACESRIEDRLNISDDELFNLARANIEKFTVVGLFEFVDDFLMSIDEELGISLNRRRPRENETKQRARIEDVPLAIQKRIMDLNQIDFALYDYVQRRIVGPRIGRRLYTESADRKVAAA